MLYQNAIGVNSQRKFYRVFRMSFPEKTLLSQAIHVLIGVLVNSYRCLL